MDLVSPDDRARTLSDCRHLVADGNGNDHDQSLAGDDQHETRLRDASVSRGLCRDSGWTGTPCRKGGGLLTLTKPWPAMLRGIYGDPDRFVQAYWSRWSDGTYFTGDGARLDDDGFYWLLGRVDDVLNVAGHRL